MIHVLFGEDDAKVLQQAIELDDSLQGEIVVIKDDYSLGPISDLQEESGREIRKDWWKEVWSAGDPKQGEWWEDDHEKIIRLQEQLKDKSEETVWIWAAQNKQDVSGYYWTLPYLKEFSGRIFILYLNNLPFINEKGNIFYPTKLSEIPAKEFLKARKLAREITLSEFEIDPDEWVKLCQEIKGVRILEGGKKLAQYEYEFFDNDLRKFVMPDWQKATKIVHNYQNKAKHQASESYLIWRLKKLISDGKFEVQGNIEKIKDLEIKNKSAASVVNE